MKGGRITLDTAEAVPVENISDSEMLMIWRYKAEMVQDGESFGSYYLDSNPFTVRLLKPETPSAQPHTGDESDPIRWMGMMLIGITALGGTVLIRIKTGK